MLIGLVKGLYMLIIEVVKNICTYVGSLGYNCFSSGVYGYIGSAKGFGGIEARVKHHLNKDKKSLRWHIDYLTVLKDVVIKNIVYVETMFIDEEDVAKGILKSGCWDIAVRGFGSTDKRSPSHLFKCTCSFQECIEDIKQFFNELGLDVKMVNLS